jgi:glycosyltransferase involved in cell wall biosynthesis
MSLSAKVVAPEQPAASTERRLKWHIITCEYPPQIGGVSDYTCQLAQGIASSGDEVHVWCPGVAGNAPQIGGVELHPVLGNFSVRDLHATGRQLDRFPSPRRLLVQWVPHGFGYKSLNLPFCLWLWNRSARHGDRVNLMVHEPSLPFQRNQWRQNAAAFVHRLMTMIVLRAAQRVCVSTPAWEARLRPYDWGRHQTFHWLPVPSNIRKVNGAVGTAAIRVQYAGSGPLVGHFGTFGQPTASILRTTIPALLERASSASVLLMGMGSSAFRKDLIQECPHLANRVHATGKIEAHDRLSLHLSACDLMLQPFPEGVTSRRSSLMAALSHGLATVTTAGTHTEPFWRTSGAVALAPAGDATVLVDVAIRLLASPQERALLGDAALELYRRRFSIEHIVGQLRSLEE